MNDNVKRAARTMIQVVLGILATGGLTKVWESFSGTHAVDPTVQVIAGLLLVGVVTWAQALIEDKTGKGVLVPLDRQVGDAVLGRGIGNKKFAEGVLPASAQVRVSSMTPMGEPQPRSY